MIGAFVYGVFVQATLTLYAGDIGGAFVTDPAVIAEVARILPIVVATFLLAGPIMMVGAYFQAIGDAGRAAVLGLTKNYVFAIPLTFALAGSVGEVDVWLSGPVSDLMLLALTLAVLQHTATRTTYRLGLFWAPRVV